MTNPTNANRPELKSRLSRRMLLETLPAALSVGLLQTPTLALAANLTESKMSPEKTAELVRRGYHGFNTADMALLTELFHADSTWETPGKSSMGGLFKGRNSVFQHFGAYGQASEGTLKAELQYVIADGEGRAIGVHRNTAKRQGRTLDTLCCIAFQIKDGKIVSGKEHFFDLYNWDSFWA